VKRFLTLVLSGLIIVAGSGAAADLSCNLYGTLTAAGSPYTVVGDLSVPAGTVVTIEPGCQLTFAGPYQLHVQPNATLLAIGTAADEISFTAADTNVRWGGIYLDNVNPATQITFSRIEYAAQIGAALGGAITVLSSAPFIADNTITHNTAEAGGGLYFYLCDGAIVQNNVISDNHAVQGGGLASQRSNLTISGNELRRNSSNMQGGAIFLDYELSTTAANSIISNNIITDNSSGVIAGNPGTGVSGAGIYCEGINGLTIANNEISHNEIMHGDNAWPLRVGGGGLALSFCTDVDISNTIFHNNATGASRYGDAIMAEDGSSITLQFCTVWGHTSTAGYCTIGILDNSSAALLNCTIADNATAPVRCDASDLSMTNTICFNPTLSVEILALNSAGRTIAVTYSDILGGWTGLGTIDVNPLFCAPDIGDFGLASISLCLGAGEGGADIGAFGLGCTATDAPDDDPLLPHEYALLQNYPNPFNPTTTIAFRLPVRAHVTLDVYSIVGRKVATLVARVMSAGEHEAMWDGRDDLGRASASGVYFYRLEADEYVATRRMVLIK